MSAKNKVYVSEVGLTLSEFQAVYNNMAATPEYKINTTQLFPKDNGKNPKEYEFVIYYTEFDKK